MAAALTYGLANSAHAAELTPEVLEKLRGDLQQAYDEVFAVKWGVLPALVVQGADESVERVLHFVDTIPEAPDALAYHTVDAQGRPVLRLGVETIRASMPEGSSLLDELSKAASHEIFETAVNPFVADYTYVSNSPKMLSKEVCDPVQGGWWRMNDSAFAMSNFVTPAYFDEEDVDGPFDYLNTLVAPLSCAADGYQAWSDGSQTFGASVAIKKQFQVETWGRHAARSKTGLVLS